MLQLMLQAIGAVIIGTVGVAVAYLATRRASRFVDSQLRYREFHVPADEPIVLPRKPAKDAVKDKVQAA